MTNVQTDYAPRVGVATLVFNNGKLLLGLRNKSPGLNSWQCPGGWLRSGEPVFDCACRKTREETGLNIQPLSFGPYTNNVFPDESTHSVTLYVVAEWPDAEISKLNQHMDNWQWFDPLQLPEPLFLPIQLLQQYHAQWWRETIESL